MKKITGGVCAPKGFMAAGIRCGIKASSVKKDLALIYSQKLCAAAAMFTKNKVKAASVLVSQENIRNGKLQAIIANSGNANACTGEQGTAAALHMTQLVSDSFQLDPSLVAVASTGVIGVPLPLDPIVNNFPALKAALRSDEQGHSDALEAIMTTDIRRKEIAVEIKISGKPARIGAIAKGSGMIHPNMATMLCFITTDAAIEQSALDAALRRSVAHSFNRLTVDGDTSTNDMILIMANGEAGNEPITNVEYEEHGKHEPRINTDSTDLRGLKKEDSYNKFYTALEYVCVELTKMMARDGEGATKLVTVTVKGARSEETAELLAKSVASSSLVKAACFGADANWGRVLCAMGYSGADFSESKVSVSFSSKAGAVKVCQAGMTVSFSEEKAKEILSQEEIEIIIELQDGAACACAWGCDLTYDYVKINGDYRS